ncbi:MAG: barstar family protein [Lachnospiraceae bacterium]|nr:barstar family protein [Lachnospiraceae bacterium]
MEYMIDASKLNDRKEAHEYLAKLFSFPSYYGKNLDALYDCISEMNIKNIKVRNAEAGEYYYFAVMDVFKDLDIEIEYI